MREHPRTFVALATLLAVFGLFVFSPQSASPTRSDSRPSLATAGEKDQGEDGSYHANFLQPLMDFMGDSEPPSRTAARDEGRRGMLAGLFSSPSASLAELRKQSKEQQSQLLRRVRKQHAFRCLIVSVPDPLLSPFASQFDLFLDAVQRAVETHRDGVLDRMWLPWRFKGRKATSSTSQHKDLFESQPGSMLFRLSPDEDHPKLELLLVLLVGETPTAGIHKEALTAALDFLSLNADEQGNNAKPEFNLLGPVYSGSETSLRETLIAWAKDPENKKGHPLRIISGSATGIDKKRFDCDLHRYYETDGFHATVIPDRLIFEELLSATSGIAIQRDKSPCSASEAPMAGKHPQ